MLTGDMKRMVGEQRLAFAATVCPDGTANLSPKGTTVVWDDRHLAFVDLASPQTVATCAPTRRPPTPTSPTTPAVRSTSS